MGPSQQNSGIVLSRRMHSSLPPQRSEVRRHVGLLNIHVGLTFPRLCRHVGFGRYESFRHVGLWPFDFASFPKNIHYVVVLA